LYVIFHSFHKFRWYKTIFDNHATKVSILYKWKVWHILPMTEITISVKVTLIPIIWIIEHSMFDKIGIQGVIYVNSLGDVFLYWFLRRLLLLVQENTDNHRVRIFYVFTHLITESNFVCLSVCFFHSCHNSSDGQYMFIWWDYGMCFSWWKWQFWTKLLGFQLLESVTLYLWQDCWNIRSNSEKILKIDDDHNLWFYYQQRTDTIDSV
jgi:hypothetical protein